MAKHSTKKRIKILIALSGGVDSAVSAFLLKKAGYDVEAVYFNMLDDNECANSVKKIADYLAIKLIKIGLKRSFKKEIRDYFVNEYSRHRIPNPCVICNEKIKFTGLFMLAGKLGIKFVATGHYAKIDKKNSGFILKKARDSGKDQSYFLYRLKQKQLGRIKFPLGNYLKSDVKKLAASMRLPIGQKESQNVCFFGKNEKLEDYLEKHIELKPGDIRDENKNILGRHNGLALFAQGQRFGLGLSKGPYFVIGKESENNILLVSKDKDHPLLRPKLVEIENSTWIAEEPKIQKNYTTKSRYRTIETPAKIIKKISSIRYIAQLDALQWAVTPGQSLVFYEGRKVLGGGIVAKINGH